MKKWVFLHGLMGYGLNWRKIALEMSEAAQVLIFDQRGHGRSMKPEHGYAPTDFANDLFEILRELRWTRIYLVGHSMGGRNAVAFAGAHPEMLEYLVIEDIGPDGRPEATAYFNELFSSIPTPFPSKQRAKDFFMNEFKGSKFGQRFGTSETLGQYLYSNLTDGTNGPVDWRFNPNHMLEIIRTGRASDHWEEFRRLTMPTLLIRGENSQDLDRDTFLRCQLANPRIRGLEIPNAGHWVHYDQPELFVKALRDLETSALLK